MFEWEPSYRVVAEDINQPWSVTAGPDGYLWITENDHFVSRVHPLDGSIHPLHVDMPFSRDDYYAFFMHGLAFHTDFEAQPVVFLSYIVLDHDNMFTGKLYVLSMLYDSATNSLSSPNFLISGLYTPNTMVVGGRLLTDGPYLFVTTADEREVGGFSQDISDLKGKVLRYYLDGSIPEDNPFPGSPVFTYGHRNPQGIVSVKGNIYISEHGSHHNDEINLLRQGGNYGWPNVSGYGEDDTETEFIQKYGVALPIFAWTPTIAPSSLGAIYLSNKLYFLVPTLKEADLRLLIPDKKYGMKEVALLVDERFGRIRDICVTPDNRVFITTFNRVQRNFSYQHTPPKDESYRYDLLVELMLDPF